MHYSSWISLLCTTLWISTSYAAPKPATNHAIVKRVPTRGRMKNGVTALSKSYRRYGWKLPQGVIDHLKETNGVETNQKIAAAADNELSSEPAKGHGSGIGKANTYPANEGSEYLCPVSIGGQTLHMNLDTGSSDLWMFSTSLEPHERGTHTLYDPLKSPNHQAINQATFEVSYGDDTSLTGNVAADTVVIGGVTVAAQTLAMPTSFSAGIIDDPADGIVGLGFQKMNSICSSAGKSNTSPSDDDNDDNCPQGYRANPRPTWFENAKAALKTGVFTANLKAGTPGYYNFGSIDHSIYKGQLQYIPIDSSKGFWQFPSTKYRVGKQGPMKTYAGADGIADSGTSLLMLQPEVVDAYYKGVKGAKKDSTGYTFPCDATLPDFEIGMGDYVAVIGGKLMNYAATSNGNMCYGGLQSNDGQAPQIFGDIMFKAQFVVFDYNNLRLGLAPHV